MKRRNNGTVKWILAWILICLLCLAAACAASESIYTGTWYLITFTENMEVYRIPSLRLQTVPEITFLPDQTAKVILDNSIRLEGQWAPLEEGDGLWLYTGFLDDIRFFFEDGRLVAKEDNRKDGKELIVFAREEKQSPAGTWEMTFSAGLGASVQSLADSNLNRIELNADNTARRYSLDENGRVFSEEKGIWTRKGNDIIFSIQARDENGTETYIPYQYYRMDTGLLIRYTQYDHSRPVVHIWTNQELKPRNKEISSVKPFLNTKWVQTGEKMLDYNVPAMLLDNHGIEIINFDGQGGCRIDVGAYGSVNGKISLDKGKMIYTYGKEKATAYMTDTGFLALDIGDGTVLYFQKAQDTKNPDDLTALDLRIKEKKGRNTVHRGDKLSFSAEFVDSSVVNSKAKNNKVEWKVADETGMSISGLSIDKKGNLSVGKKCQENITAIVSVKSVSFGTVAEYPVRIAEKTVTGLKLSTKGNAKPGKKVTVSAKITPQDASNKVLEWSLINVDESIAAISEDGVVSISPDAPAGTVIKVRCRAVGAEEPVTAEIEIKVKK